MSGVYLKFFLMKISARNILWGYAFFVIVMAYICGLFIDLTGDSGLYAAISRQMVESGNWLALKINGEPYDQKPHLLFWLAGPGISFLGNINFAFKILPALWAFAGGYFTYRLGKLLYSEKEGRLAALFHGTSQIFFLYLLDIHTDTVLQTGVIFALWQLAAYFKLGRTLNFILGFVGIGLAMLAKGPVGAVVPFFFVLLCLLLQKRYSLLLHPKWLLGIIIVFLVVSPSLIHLYKNFGAEGLRFYFITNNFGRISGEYAGSSNDPFYYLYNSAWAFLPWTVFVFFAVFSEIKSWVSKGKEDIWASSLLGSVLIFTAILSIAKGKAPNYFLLAVPAIAVVTAKWTEKAMDTKKVKGLMLAQKISMLLLLVIIALLIYISEEKYFALIAVLLLLALGVGFFFKRQSTSKSERALFASVLLAGVLNLYLNVVVLPQLFKYQGARQALNIFEGNSETGDKLYNLDLEEYELFFMAKNTAHQISNWDSVYSTMERSGSWVYTNQIKYNDIKNMKYDIDTVFSINQRGMNKLNFNFLSPKIRKETLRENFLIKTK